MNILKKAFNSCVSNISKIKQQGGSKIVKRNEYLTFHDNFMKKQINNCDNKISCLYTKIKKMDKCINTKM